VPWCPSSYDDHAHEQHVFIFKFHNRGKFKFEYAHSNVILSNSIVAIRTNVRRGRRLMCRKHEAEVKPTLRGCEADMKI